MNQTKKRLNIIKLAISITDIETIQLQILKLTPIKTDTNIQEILTVLQAGNYAQAQALISNYIDTAPDEILQRTSQTQEKIIEDEKQVISDEDQAIIDEFQLFITPTTSKTEVEEIDINDYPSIQPKIKKEKHSIDFDSLLNLDADDVLKDNISIDISDKRNNEQDNFFENENEETFKSLLDETSIKRDTFFEEMEKLPNELEEDTEAILNEKTINNDKEDDEEKDIFPKSISEEVITPKKYKAMPYISQKFISMKKQYPPIQKTYEKFDTVESLLTKIADEGYTEAEIEEMITYIYKLMEKAEYTEAAQLLLVCAATESQFAQFMLARELYTGSVLTKNIPEAFTLMNTLAVDDYPEALCDIGQFYENGIGTSPDLVKAEAFYKESANKGIQRAKKHYTRLKKLNRGFFKKS
jgi:hypothetical protein